LILLPPDRLNQIDQYFPAQDVRYTSLEKFDQRPFIPSSGFKETLASRLKRYYCDFGFSSALFQFFSRGNERVKRKAIPSCMVKISHGCFGKCSYCAVRFARGTLKSRPVEDILYECRQRIQQGFSRIRLVATDSGCYGLDIGSDFPALLKEISGLRGVRSLVIDDINPKWIIKYCWQIIEALRNFEGHVELKISIQSASDRILEKMNREYRSDDIAVALMRFKKLLKNLTLMTNVIVGFPSETKEDFLKTKLFLRMIQFDRMLVYKYSDRSGTEAFKMKKKIDDKTKSARMRALEAQQFFVTLKKFFSSKQNHKTHHFADFDWEKVMKSEKCYIHPFLGSYKSEDFFRIMEEWTSNISAKSILKTDLREESSGLDTILFELNEQPREVCGIDASYSIVMRADKNCRSRGLDQKYITSDVRELAFQSESFDIILSTSTLDHFENEEQLLLAFLELKRTLKPDGKMILSFNNKWNISFYLMSKLEKMLGRKKYPVRFYTFTHLNDLCQCAGLEILNKDFSVHLPSPLNSIILGFDKLMGKRIGDVIANVAVCVAKIMGRIPVINRLTAWFIVIECKVRV